MKEIEGGITAPKGFKASGVHCGIKKNEPDLALIYSEVPSIAWGMFTTNKVKAAPVQLSIKKIRNHCAQAIVANSGIANTCTGKRGLRDAKKMAEIAGLILLLQKKLMTVFFLGKFQKLLLRTLRLK